MKNIIGGVGVAVFAAVGGFGGQMLNTSSGGEAHAVETDAGHGDDGNEGDDHGKDDKSKKGYGHDDEHESYAEVVETQYFNFNREFIVPLMGNQRVESLILININLEVEEKMMEKMFSIRPKLRDNIMTTLVELSNDGKTLEEPTNVDSYETIRSVILANLDSVVAIIVRL